MADKRKQTVRDPETAAGKTQGLLKELDRRAVGALLAQWALAELAAERSNPVKEGHGRQGRPARS